MTPPPTFGLSSSADFLEELRQTVADLQKDPINPRLARYAAIVAWSMCDWVKEETKPRISLSKLQKQCKERCPELGYLQELGNVFKHRELRSSTTITLKAAYKTGGFSREFSRAFDIVRLELVLEDGCKVMFDDVVQRTLDFWDQFFRDNCLRTDASQEL